MADASSTFNQSDQSAAQQFNFGGGTNQVFLGAPPAVSGPLWVNVPPPPAQPLVGRAPLLDELVAALTAGGSNVALSTEGQGGAGKTALAIALAHDPRVRAHFTGGVLWAGLGLTPDPATVLIQWGRPLGLQFADVLSHDERRSLLDTHLGDRRVLVVLDDAWDAETPARLRLGAAGAVHLLTTRDRGVAAGFAGEANRRHVPALDPDPAFALLARLAPAACGADPGAARALAHAVGGLPLALVLLGGYLAAQKGNHFPAVRAQALQRAGSPATRLHLACTRLADPTGMRVELGDVITLSLADLPASVRAAFSALGAFAPKPALFDLAAAKAVTGADEEVLGTLIDRNLLELDTAGNLSVHQVVADVACAQCPAATLAAHDAYYLGLVQADKEDWRRIEGVYDQVQHALARLPVADPRLIPWALALFTYWDRRGLGGDGLRWTERALAVAATGGNLATQGKLCNNLGEFYYAHSEYPPAMEVYRRALDLYRQAGDAQGEAEALHCIGGVYGVQGDTLMELDYLNQALPLRRQVGDKPGEAATLHNIGWVYSALRDKQQALGYYNQALPLRRQVGDKRGEAATLTGIGAVYSALGDKQQALDYFNQALPLRRQVGDRAGEATTLTNIGKVYADLGDQQQALGYYNQALPLRRQVGDKAGEATTLNSIGKVCADLGDKQQALDYYNQALPLRRQVGDRNGERVTRWNIAMVCGYYLNDLNRAVAELEQVVALDEAIHHPKLERDRAELAYLRARRDARR